MALGHLGADSALAIMVIVLALVAMTAVARRLRDALVPLAERIDAVLPQTHCAQCGYGGCMPYANAVAAGAAAINRCPPGGPPVIRKLARITGRPYADLDPACGSPKPRQLAVIDEGRCIGCTLCIRACPVDAIVGASKLMHTVIASECTGCELCLPPCPVDCIALVPAPWTLADYVLRKKAHSEENARKRYAARARRLERDRLEHAARLARATAERAARASTMPEQPDRKQQIVAAAIARARRKLAEREPLEA